MPIIHPLMNGSNLMTTLLTIILITITVTISLLVVCYVILVLVTVFLGFCTELRTKYRNSNSCLLVGRVSHSRQLPAVHGFSYPIFMILLDLQDNFNDMQYPLSIVAQLREEDHFKNNEGQATTAPTQGRDEHDRLQLSLLDRTFQLVAEKTNNKFQPTRDTHCVKLLTHLRYYGYCFNPVSFYYVLQLKKENDDTGDGDGTVVNYKIDAIVAEVSNTPWNEMQCYVLHPDSMDVQKVQASRLKMSDTNPLSGINYIFRKTFHVSPFMAMDQIYDWTFWELPVNMTVSQQQHGAVSPSSSSSSTLRLSTSVYQNEELYFNAYLQLSNAGCHPYRIAMQLIQFPIFCAMIQIWIHIEAFYVFYKGVTYVPHPKGSETAASALIGRMMVPVFAIKDWLDGTKQKEELQKMKAH